jgi:hypothetical protein
VFAEEVTTHVVVDALHAPTAFVEERHDLGADEAAGTGDDRCLRGHEEP